MGTEVQQFENALTEFFDRPAVCVINGTAALHLALQACGIGRGDEVLVPSLTYLASFQAISATGAKPMACDIDPEIFLLDLSDTEKRITARTKAIMPVHYTGGVGDLDVVYNFAALADLNVALEQPIKTANINIVGNLNVMEACQAHGVRRFIYASTVYVHSRDLHEQVLYQLFH